MRSLWVIEICVICLLSMILYDPISGVACPARKFGWQCRYDCLCTGSCDRVTGQCESCSGSTWGPGCLLNSSCTYNDDIGKQYQGKRALGDNGGLCSTWATRVTGYIAEQFPDSDFRNAGGYCRNPGYDSSPWCYTYLNEKWEWCTMKSCTCPNGRFGVNCESECHCSDKQNTCNSATGVCPRGCHRDFQGRSCQECRDGRFGVFCDPCHCRIPSEVCDKTTGSCMSGCAAGWTGSNCSTECKSGKYGLSCSGICSDHCEEPNVCDKITGSCTCEAGYQPSTCHDACEKDRYGLNCSGICSDHCEEPGVCNKESGTCSCQAGYQPPTCLHACGEGRYGLNCTDTCSDHCDVPGVCDKITGTCTCQAGYRPPTCHEECRDGTFGMNCGSKCRCLVTTEDCNKTSGTCTWSGCAAGWHGQGCQTGCNPGTYGINCNETCPENCLDTLDCDPKNGSCDCKQFFSGIRCAHSKTPLPANSPQMSGIIAGTTAGCVCLLIIVILLVVWLRRRDRHSDSGFRQEDSVKETFGESGKNPDKQPNTGAPNQDEGNEAASSSAPVDLDAVYCNLLTEYDKTSISVSQFPDYIRFMTDTPGGFEDEYKAISIEPSADVTVGKMEVNRSRNRFRNIIPYNHNRVKLQTFGDDPVSSYINASYIPGYGDSVTFIAAQGPVEGTLADFILMVWENDVPLIVMVTELKEYKAKKAKCEQYWPDDKKPKVFNEIIVSLKKTEQKPHYITRELILHKDDDIKSVRHMQFISWPDHGTPLSPTAFLTYHKEAASHYDNTRGPMVVHCSAGVGRTGTFLAMDYLLKQAQQEGRVSVYNCVVEMRKHRVNMVQSLDQYKFIHEALLEALHCGKVVHDVTTFETWINEHQSEELKTQFQMLEKMRRPVRPQETTAGRLEENKRKNRNQKLLPLDKWRPLLMTPVPRSNDYINAVFVKSDVRSDSMLATQSPLESTVNDFWRLIHDYECNVVVALNKFETEEIPDYTMGNTYGPFRVSVKSTTREEGFVKSIVLYSVRQLEQEKVVHLATTRDTPDGSLPDINTYITLVEAAQSTRQGDTTGRTIVHCRNGLNETGFFCALSLICQKVKDEQEVDVFHAVKQIRISRPEFITSPEEYQWLHQAALRYIQSFSTYANFR